MLRLVRRDPNRPPDVLVDRSATEPVTARAIPRPRAPEAAGGDGAPDSTEVALEALGDSGEVVHTSELILEGYDERPHEPTPVTPVAVWQRLIPPPLPEKP